METGQLWQIKKNIEEISHILCHDSLLKVIENFMVGKIEREKPRIIYFHTFRRT